MEDLTPEQTFALLEALALKVGLVKQFYCSSLNKDGGVCHAFPCDESDMCKVHSRIDSKRNPNPPFALVLAKKVKETSDEIQKPDRIKRCFANTLNSVQCKLSAGENDVCAKHLGHQQCDDPEPYLFRCTSLTGDGSRCSNYSAITTCGIHTKIKEQPSTPKTTVSICVATQKNGVKCPNPAKFGHFCGKHNPNK